MKRVRKRKKYRMLWILFWIIVIIAVVAVVFVNQPSFGRKARGERMERIKNSPNYREGKFQNLHETQQITSDKGFASLLYDFLFVKKERLRPEKALPVIKTDLWQLEWDKDILIWFGHSSYLIQTDGKRFLIDPVLHMASPVSFFNKAFEGTDIYKPEDIPDIDYLIITHDHWDHLDYKTVKNLKERTGKVICGLGVGEHLEYWGFEKDKIIELDWNEEAVLGTGFKVYCLPARHFSGRGLSPNQTLWASYFLETPSQRIYIAGDGGYDTHFAEIGNRFAPVDLAIIENGQYNKDWKYIHLMPEYLTQTIKDLNPTKTLAVHNSKYALAKHPWDEPLINISQVAERDSLNVITPIIGETVYLKDSTQVFSKWCENVDK
ncbi:MAG: MBL fold metallo-hydrolase [Odoribacter sp.]|nr:MBL fold metallo-hydrolase [Odoribacter sp.]